MKYIDAELLRKEIEKERKSIDGLFTEGDNNFYDGQDDAYNHTLALIDSLRQEQSDFPTTDEQIKEFLATHPKVEVPNKYKTPDWLWKKQEQPEVDLEKEIEIFTVQLYHETFGNGQGTLDEFDWEDIATVIEETAHHFCEFGLRRAAEIYDNIEYNGQRAEEEGK